MNKICSILLIAASSCLSCYADGIVPKQPGDNIPIKPIDKPGSNGGHRIPSAIVMTAYYDNGTLTFAGAEAFGTLAATVTCDDTGECWNALVDGESPAMETGSQPGSYTIVLTAIDGRQFTGFYTL